MTGGLVTQLSGPPASGWTPPKPTRSASLLLQTVQVARVFSLWAALPPLLRGLSPGGRVPARLNRLPAAQLWVTPRPAVPGWPLCAPPAHWPSATASTSPEAWVSVSPNLPPKHSSALPPGPFHSAHRGQPGTAGWEWATPVSQGWCPLGLLCPPPTRTLVPMGGDSGVEP